MSEDSSATTAATPGESKEKAHLDVGVYTFPWALAAEGPERVLELLQERASCSAVVVAGHYHTAKFLHPRPHPHFYYTEATTAYFRPAPELYRHTAIKPVVSQLAQSCDVFARTRHLARLRGMRFHAWLVCLHSTVLGARHADCVVRNAFGDPVPFALSPSHPDVQEFVCALVSDIASTYEPDRIELESIEYVPTDHGYHHELDGVSLDGWHRLLIGLDFSPSAMLDAERRGVDAERARVAVRELLLDYFADPGGAPGRSQSPDRVAEINKLLTARNELIAELVGRISRTTPVPVDVILSPWNRRVATLALEGHDPRLLARQSSRLLMPLYTADPAEMATELAALKEQLGSLAQVTPVLYLLHQHTPSEGVLEAACNVLRAAGIERVNVYNHAFMATPSFDWLGRAVHAPASVS